MSKTISTKSLNERLKECCSTANKQGLGNTAIHLTREQASLLMEEFSGRRVNITVWDDPFENTGTPGRTNGTLKWDKDSEHALITELSIRDGEMPSAIDMMFQFTFSDTVIYSYLQTGDEDYSLCLTNALWVRSGGGALTINPY